MFPNPTTSLQPSLIALPNGKTSLFLREENVFFIEISKTENVVKCYSPILPPARRSLPVEPGGIPVLKRQLTATLCFRTVNPWNSLETERSTYFVQMRKVETMILEADQFNLHTQQENIQIPLSELESKAIYPWLKSLFEKREGGFSLSVGNKEYCLMTDNLKFVYFNSEMTYIFFSSKFLTTKSCISKEFLLTHNWSAVPFENGELFYNIKKLCILFFKDPQIVVELGDQLNSLTKIVGGAILRKEATATNVSPSEIYAKLKQAFEKENSFQAPTGEEGVAPTRRRRRGGLTE